MRRLVSSASIISLLISIPFICWCQGRPLPLPSDSSLTFPLFPAAGGGLETDTYQHVSSALHVIRTLTTAQTPSNPESSRAGFFYEIQIQDRSIHKAKIHACFVDHVRVTNLKREERSFNIFYQMLAGKISCLMRFTELLLSLSKIKGNIHQSCRAKGV